MFFATLLAGVLGISLFKPEWIAGLILQLPAGGDFPAPVHSAAVYFGHSLASVNFIFPVDTLVTIMLIGYNMTIVLLVFYFIRFVFLTIRGVNTNRFIQ